MKQEISNSEMGTFRTCRKKHGFEYIQLLRPKLKVKILTWGNTIHAGIEEGYKAAYANDTSGNTRLANACEGGDSGVRDYHATYLVNLDSAVRDGLLSHEDAQERFEDAAQLLRVALWAVPHFFNATADDLEKLIPIGFELPFRVPIYNAKGISGGRLYGKGVIDALWWDPEMERIIVDDHKTVDDLVGTTEKRIALDPQMSGYMHAAQHKIRTGEWKPRLETQAMLDCWNPAALADSLGACRYNVIRRQAPKQPKINKVAKNDGPVEAVGRDPWPVITKGLKELEVEHDQSLGLVSTAAIDTTYAIYDAALAKQISERHLPMTDKQLQLARRLEGQGDRYFGRLEFWRNADEREEWRREVWIEAKFMREAERNPALQTRNPGACTTAASMPCAYRPVCLEDVPETRAIYRQATKRHEEVSI